MSAGCFLWHNTQWSVVSSVNSAAIPVVAKNVMQSARHVANTTSDFSNVIFSSPLKNF
jgi:hypothetical protein